MLEQGTSDTFLVLSDDARRTSAGFDLVTIIATRACFHAVNELEVDCEG